MSGSGTGTPAGGTSDYGSVAGVQNKVANLVTFTATSKPYTTTDVTDALTTESSIMDMKLGAAGYATPVTALAALGILNECANLLVAATVYEAIAIARDPGALDQAKEWRDRAMRVLDAVYSGEAVLPDATRATDGSPASTVPASTCADTAFPAANTDTFVENYGTNFSGA